MRTIVHAGAHAMRHTPDRFHEDVRAAHATIG
jgi:hypothetical protein